MRTFTFSLLLLFTPLSFAAGPLALPVTVSGFLERQSISLSGEKFEPVLAGATLGAWIYEGIGIEIGYGASISDDTVASLALETNSQWSVGVRFESAPIDGIAAYALFAVSSVSINSRFTAGVASSEDSHFRGARGVFGLTFPLRSRWAVDAAFVRHEYDDDFGINGVRIGLRYNVNNVRPRARRGWWQ